MCLLTIYHTGDSFRSQLLCDYVSQNVYVNKHSSSQHRRDGLSLLHEIRCFTGEDSKPGMTRWLGLEGSLWGSFTHMICTGLNFADLRLLRVTWLPQSTMASGWSDLRVQGSNVEPYSEKAGLPHPFWAQPGGHRASPLNGQSRLPTHRRGGRPQLPMEGVSKNLQPIA